MKQAFGGIFNIMFIVIFLVVAIGVLGLTFSYTKAFKMKSAIIAAIEEYEGNVNHPGFKDSVKKEAKSLGYGRPATATCPSGFTASDYFCYTSETTSYPKALSTIRYTVVVQTDISIPLIKNIVGFSIFQVSGDTKEIVIRNK